MENKQVSIYISAKRNPVLYHFCRVSEEYITHSELLHLLKDCLEYYTTTDELKIIGGIQEPEQGRYDSKESVCPCLYITAYPGISLYVDMLKMNHVSVSGMLCKILEQSVNIIGKDEEIWFLNQNMNVKNGLVRPDLERIRVLGIGREPIEQDNRKVHKANIKPDTDNRTPSQRKEAGIKKSSTPQTQKMGTKQAGGNKQSTNPLAGLMGYVSS